MKCVNKISIQISLKTLLMFAPSHNVITVSELWLHRILIKRKCNLVEKSIFGDLIDYIEL